MAEYQSKERIRAEAAFAKTLGGSNEKSFVEPLVSKTDQNTARLKAARLARDGSTSEIKKP
ncbi:hypothetical protein [Methylobacterium brachythecii]|uniref:Uncharacterized protein n=1 Tax=Methylobacterium brachythecii TaxID=1176177 RepID=A0A7W6AM03_9HYPH|nr:hypothetical protein [Methylobacterium brachythecii]MBB3904209.1 hypothetical protein [Methylobacterium brachythecii]